MPKPQIYLHIGHGKTGTSAIQSAFAIAQKDLLKQGIEYPIQNTDREKASQFAITSGNWIYNPKEPLAQELTRRTRERNNNNSILLSSESLFWQLDSLFEDGFQELKDLNLHVLLAVREIEEMLSSEYQQRQFQHEISQCPLKHNTDIKLFLIFQLSFSLNRITTTSIPA